jgi:hypothetical protein
VTLPLNICEFVDDSEPVVCDDEPKLSQKRMSLAILMNRVPDENCSRVSAALDPLDITVVLIAGSDMIVLPIARPLC